MRWLRESPKKRILRALRHPLYTAKSLLNDLRGVDELFLASLTNSTSLEIQAFLNEPFGRPDFLRYLRECEAALQKSDKHPGNAFFTKKVLVQYALVRALAPDVIVETGVANGISSIHLLLACQLNGKGHLYSIDIADCVYVPSGKAVGWIVPEVLRDRWTLMIGDALKVLPELLSDLGSVDMFIHDSDHSYEHMKFEFEQAYPHIRPGGLLLSDDSDFNSAFEECVKTVHPAASRVIRNIGIIKK